MLLALFLAPATAALLRWVAFSAATLVVGVAAYVELCKGRGAVDGERTTIRPLLRASGIAIIATGVARLAQQAYAFAPHASDVPTMIVTLLGMTWGIAWVAQMGAALWITARPTDLMGGRSGMFWTLARAALVFALLVAPAFQGHAVGSPELTALAVVADIIHLAAAGVWIGTLVVLVVVAIPTRDHASVSALVRAFSPVALAGASALGITGLFATWLHVRELPLLWSSGYGRMVVFKLVLVSCVVALGAINWKRITPRLTQPGGVVRLRAAARVELMLAAAVLAATAILVATPLPRE